MSAPRASEDISGIPLMIPSNSQPPGCLPKCLPTNPRGTSKLFFCSGQPPDKLNQKLVEGGEVNWIPMELRCSHRLAVSYIASHCQKAEQVGGMVPPKWSTVARKKKANQPLQIIKY